MKKMKLQKKHIFMIVALTVVSVILVVSLIFFLSAGSFKIQTIPLGASITLLVFLIVLPVLLVAFMFVKKSKSTFWIGALIVGISIMFISFLLFMAMGTFDTRPKLIFSSQSASKEYDSAPLICEQMKLEQGQMKEGEYAVMTALGSRTDAGISQNYFSVIVLDKNAEDVTAKYNTECRPGELSVTARKLSIKSASAFKEYDGTSLEIDGFQISSGEVLIGQNLIVQTSGERTDAGSSSNTFSAAITDDKGNDITYNYDIEKIFGTLEVAKKNITISTPSYHGVYDERPITLKEWEYASETRILSQHQIQVVISGSQTDAGISKNSISEVRVTENGKNVTNNYSFTYLEGDLIVTKRNITVRSQSSQKEYDGVPLTNNNWDYASMTKVVNGHTIEVIISGSRTEPGESENTIAEVLIKNEKGRDVGVNYEILYQLGSLIVGDKKQIPPGESGDAELDESGNIGSLPPGEGGSADGGNGKVAARVFSASTNRIYLRYMSFGDYTGKMWNKASDYAKHIDSKYSFNYLTGIALENSGYESAAALIQSFSSNYLLPYYLDTDELAYQIQKSDVQYVGNTDSIYSAYHYLFDYEIRGLNLSLPTGLQVAEREYYNYVKNAYIAMPQSSAVFFSQIIAENGFDKNDPDIIRKVAQYIQKSATYSQIYDRNLDTSTDIAVSFLEKYKEGICQHFATAATMLYRALGIPARYVIGYAGDTKSQEWVDFTGDNAHAWVEVYAENIGWIQVEVTAPGYDDDFSGGGTEGGGSNPKLNLKPVDCYMQYFNGVELLPENRIQGLSELLLKGYSYKAEVSGKQTSIGIGYSVIDSFALYDSSGVDVTEKFNIVYKRGKLQIYVRELNITTESLTKIYDGTSLSSKGEKTYSLEGELIKGHRLKNVTMQGSQTNVGKSQNLCIAQIVDELDRDVTHLYKINFEFGILTVDARSIIITASSASKVFDQTPLKNPDYFVTTLEGEPLGQGDQIKVEIIGSQTEVGKSQNEISSVKIINKQGKDVTSNYSIKYLSGWLIVTK